MEIIADAEKALLRNWRSVALYMAASVALVIAYVGMYNWLEVRVPEDTSPKPTWYLVVTLVMELTMTGAVAALQAILFAEIGAEIDRPLWKSGGYVDALKRFMGLWFMVSLIYLAIVRIQGSLLEQGLQTAAVTLELPRILWSCAYMPVAVCIMYGGKLVWEEVPERLSPMFHQYRRAAVAFGLGFLQFIAWDVMMASLPEAYQKSAVVRGLANLPLLLLECLAFAVMWHACMAYRDTAHERDDDFDF